MTNSAFLWLVVLFAACETKPAKPSADAAPKSDLAAKGIAMPEGASAAAKGAVVSQQCAIVCGAKLGIDTGACTSRCVTTCANENDVPAIDACANKTADASPAL